MTLRLLTPSGAPVEKEVSIVTLPGAAGPFQVLRGHAALLSPLIQGKISFRGDSVDESVEVKGGFVRVENDIITVCAEL